MWRVVEQVFVFCLLVAGCSSQQGTTQNLEQIFIGRCWEYQRTIRPEKFNGNEKNCTELWTEFSGAFAYKPECTATTDDYVPFADKAAHPLEPNRELFWENVYPFVNDYSQKGDRYVTVSDTLLGYMVNGLTWCGQVDPPGINYEECSIQCPNGTFYDFTYWATVSQYYSTLASGTTQVMLNGSVSVPFDTLSFFAVYELVNLVPEKNVTHLDIWVVHNLGGPIVESCGEGSLLDLENQAIAQGLTVSCVDDPESVRHFQCVDNPMAPECFLQTFANMMTTSGES